ncbi:MAG: hypothetical protein K9W44_10165 [Candidatus Lokiarchaeota archaeon]|nr:hypothetical protein [Candidatus Harpocratesius repetitus]
MELKKELIGLRIFMGSFFTEIEKTFGSSTVKAILNRMGQKPAEIVADNILKKYGKTESEPFDVPSAAFSLFQNTITKLYDAEVIGHEELKDRYIIHIKNECIYRQIIKNHEELKFGDTLCEFTFGYFETAMKKLTGLNVEYKYDQSQSDDDACSVKVIFYKKFEEIEKKPPNSKEIPIVNIIDKTEK